MGPPAANLKPFVSVCYSETCNDVVELSIVRRIAQCWKAETMLPFLLTTIPNLHWPVSYKSVWYIRKLVTVLLYKLSLAFEFHDKKVQIDVRTKHKNFENSSVTAAENKHKFDNKLKPQYKPTVWLSGMENPRLQSYIILTFFSVRIKEPYGMTKVEEVVLTI